MKTIGKIILTHFDVDFDIKKNQKPNIAWVEFALGLNNCPKLIFILFYE